MTPAELDAVFPIGLVKGGLVTPANTEQIIFFVFHDILLVIIERSHTYSSVFGSFGCVQNKIFSPQRNALNCSLESARKMCDNTVALNKRMISAIDTPRRSHEQEGSRRDTPQIQA